MKSNFQNIPLSLVYEQVNGKNIYYKGYKDYLKGDKTLDELMGSSTLQAFLAAELIFILKSILGQNFFILSNEVGLQFSKKSWRAADIALVEKTAITQFDAKYLSVPPKYVIEIDTKAELNEIKNPLSYYQEKTQELLNFGVERVVWIFTDTQKVMIANKSESWEIIDWGVDVVLMENVKVNLKKLLEENGLS